MPLSKYFSGRGEKVMSNMKKQYGPEKAKVVFYATVNKKKNKGLGPSEHVVSKGTKRNA